jgi:hypothetical protein
VEKRVPFGGADERTLLMRSVEEENDARRREFVDGIAEGGGSKWGKIRRINGLIGAGAEDLADYRAADEGEPPQGARW